MKHLIERRPSENPDLWHAALVRGGTGDASLWALLNAAILFTGEVLRDGSPGIGEFGRVNLPDAFRRAIT